MFIFSLFSLITLRFILNSLTTERAEVRFALTAEIAEISEELFLITTEIAEMRFALTAEIAEVLEESFLITAERVEVSEIIEIRIFILSRII